MITRFALLAVHHIIILMLSIGEYLSKNQSIPDSKAPSHWKADIVNQIIDLVGLSPKFSVFDKPTQFKKTYIYWLSLIKKSGKSWGDCMCLLKEANGLDSKYSKGGFITNKLKTKK